MSLTALLGFLPTLFSGVKEYVGKKQDLQKLERVASLDLRKAQLESEIRRAESNDVADTQLDSLSLKGRGWKDEYLLILTTLPLLLIMVSPFVDIGMQIAVNDEYVYAEDTISRAVFDGFLAMGKAPTEYWYAVAAVYIDALGMRRMVRLFIEKMAGNLTMFNK